MGSLKDVHARGSEALEEVRCCVCGAAPKPYAVDYHGNSIARCPRCGLRFVSPRVSLATLLKNTYDRDYFHGTEDPADARINYQRYLSDLERYRKPPGVLLDVGAGTGAFLSAARDRGWSIEANEMGPAAPALRRALGCPVHAGRFEELPQVRRYDVISLIHVLEHLLDPYAMLAKARCLLNTGGVLFAALPNTRSLNDRLKSGLSRWRLKSRRWKHLAADHHLWFFDRESLAKLAKAAGLKPVSIRTMTPSRSSRRRPRMLARGLEAAGLAPWLELIALKK